MKVKFNSWWTAVVSWWIFFWWFRWAVLCMDCSDLEYQIDMWLRSMFILLCKLGISRSSSCYLLLTCCSLLLHLSIQPTRPKLGWSLARSGFGNNCPLSYRPYCQYLFFTDCLLSYKLYYQFSLCTNCLKSYRLHCHFVKKHFLYGMSLDREYSCLL